MYRDTDDLTSLLDDEDPILSEERDAEANNQIFDKYEKEMESISRDLGIDLGGSFDAREPRESHEPREDNPISPPPSQPSQNTFFQQHPQPNYTYPQQQPQYPPQQQYPQQPYQQYPQQQYQQYPQQQYPPQPPPPQQQNYYADDEVVKESEEDEKLHLLEKIKHMTSTLEKTDEDMVSDLPTISRHNTLREIQDIHKALVQKTNRIRYTELGQSMLLGGAKLLGTVFNGNNEFFGKKIDLTGLDTRMEWKLRHIRPQIADTVQKICSRWDPMILTGVEILTLIAMHSHDTATTIKKDNLYEDYEKGTSEMYKL